MSRATDAGGSTPAPAALDDALARWDPSTGIDADLVEYRAVDDTYRWIAEVEP